MKVLKLTTQKKAEKGYETIYESTDESYITYIYCENLEYRFLHNSPGIKRVTYKSHQNGEHTTEVYFSNGVKNIFRIRDI